MAIAYSNVLEDEAAEASPVTSIETTATFTPAADTVYYASVVTKGGSTTDSTATLTGAGVTWELVNAPLRINTTSNTLTVFRAVGAGSLGALTFTRGGTNTFQTWSIAVTAVTGADLSGTNGAGSVAQVVTNQTDWNTPSATPSASLTMDSTANGVFAAFAAFSGGFTGTATSPMTELTDNTISGQLGHRTQYSVTGSVTSIEGTWSGSTTWAILGIEVQEAVVGPTITDQPDNATVLLSEGQSAVFTTEFSGSGLSGATWNVDGSPVADGGIYDIVTVIDPGDATGTSTLTVTPTVTTGSPFDIDCDVTDANGTTASATATLTVLNGDVLSTTSGTTDVSGQAVTQYTTDASAAAGTVSRVRAVSGAVTKTLAMRPGA